MTLLKGLASFFLSAFNLWGVLEEPIYDVIVIGAGAAGSPLAQTLAENGVKVLLLERGGERVESSKTLSGAVAALTDKCAEQIRSETGVTVVTGNCMGGATSVNHGIWVQEEPVWVQNMTSRNGSSAFTIDEIVAAYNWVRERVAPEPTVEPKGSASETYIQNVVKVYQNRSDFKVGNTNPGQPYPAPGNGVWRTHSTFHPTTGERRSSDTLLNRSNTNLDIRINSRVMKILFDGDTNIPIRARVKRRIRSASEELPRARCVNLEGGEVVCVKENGRIYISAGAIHTPEILLNSGIGPTGSKVINAKVGQNLVDKPALLVAGSFQHDFPNWNQLYFSHIAAVQFGPSGVRLFEELNAGIEAMLPLAVWQRNYVPTSLRNSWFAAAANGLVKFCQKNIKDPLLDSVGPSRLCFAIEPIVKAGCDKRVFGYGVLSGEPSSRGSVTLDATTGELKVNVNYMATANDKRAMGKATRVGYEMLTSHSGATAPQLPCADKTDTECMSQSCPDLIADYVTTTRKALKTLMPLQAKKFKSAPASVAYPQFLEPAMNAIKANSNSTSADDEDTINESIGELISDEIFAAHHLAGSACMGNVIDQRFAVMGTEGLYIVDASALPTTPRANPMSTIMALGHLVGLQAVQDLVTPPAAPSS